MGKISSKTKQKSQWCPMEGSSYEGFCVENFATIRLKGRKCDHKEYCENLKKELEETTDANQRN